MLPQYPHGVVVPVHAVEVGSEIVLPEYGDLIRVTAVEEIDPDDPAAEGHDEPPVRLTGEVSIGVGPDTVVWSEILPRDYGAEIITDQTLAWFASPEIVSIALTPPGHHPLDSRPVTGDPASGRGAAG